MFFCEKKIVYLTLYEYGERTAGAGFAAIQGEKDKLNLKLQVKNAGDGIFPVQLTTGHHEFSIAMLETKAGTGKCEMNFYYDGERAVIEGNKIEPEQICSVRIRLSDNKFISGEWNKSRSMAARKEENVQMQSETQKNRGQFRKESESKEQWQKEPQDLKSHEKEKSSSEKLQNSEDSERIERPQGFGKAERAERLQDSGKTECIEKLQNFENPEDIGREKDLGQPKRLMEKELSAVSLPADKWEQLKAQYRTVHPFGDKREFISIELKDFIILQDSYQKMINNSFLLHGFYNYQHLILGKDYQLGRDDELCFYLGVPGVFFEREKMVAVMFGFEGFESAGPVEIGKFGYYLRRVEI